jgi:STE24 endopeptidase
VKRVYVMDASKRSKHSNALITGLGKNKRIVLFDTLLEEITNDEIVAVFAHEIGHFKKKHFLKNFFISLSFMVCFVLLIYYFIQSGFLYDTFDISEKYTVLVYSVILISSLFSFMNFLLSYLSRKFEFEADKYAVEVSDKKAFVSALKKLGKQNLSVLEPHALYKKFYYSHPTVSEREKEINNNDQIKK